MKLLSPVLLVGLFLGAAAHAEDTIPFGGAAPAMLPAGSTAVYGYVGAPELGGGFRQGFGSVELQAEARFNYLDLGLAATGRARFLLVDRPQWQLAPYAGLGFAWDSGSTYFEDDNFQYTAVRIEAGAVATYPVRPVLDLIGTGEVTWDLFTTPVGGHRVQTLVGGGAELALGGSISTFVIGELGLDLRKAPDAGADAELGYAFRAGFAFRLF